MFILLRHFDYSAQKSRVLCRHHERVSRDEIKLNTLNAEWRKRVNVGIQFAFFGALKNLLCFDYSWFSTSNDHERDF